MSLSAFTNAIGWHEKYELVQSSINGIEDFDYDGNYNSYSYIHYQAPVRFDLSYKPPIVKGDHKTSYPYSRLIRKVLKDDPMLARRKLWSGTKVVYDEVVQTHISHLHYPFSYQPTDGGRMPNAMAEADVKALNRLQGERAQLGADLAQARQTIDMFSSNASQLARALLAAKRGRWGEIPGILGVSGRNLRRDSRTAANRWLETQYGWLPLMGSIRDLQGVVHEHMMAERTLRGTGTGSYEFESSERWGDLDYNWSWKGSARTTLTATMDNRFASALSASGLINPATVAWEILPWSFAIDWFVPVGATLEATTAGVGLNFTGGQQTRRRELRLNLNRHISGWEDPDNGPIAPGEYSEGWFDFERQRYDSLPPSRFYADLTPFSTPRALNALALVRQLFR